MSRRYGIVELLEGISVAAFTIYLFETHEDLLKIGYWLLLWAPFCL